MARRSGAQRRDTRRQIENLQGVQRIEQSPGAARILSDQPQSAPPALEAQPPVEIPVQEAEPRPAGVEAGDESWAAQRRSRFSLPPSLVPQPLPERARDAHPAYGLTTGQWVLLELTRESMRTAAPDFPAVNQTLSDLQDLEQLTRRILEFRP
jgi:hypothetical protein